MQAIPTYIINLKSRPERLKHIQKQFRGKTEFEVKVTEACEHQVGAVGLWLSIKQIVGEAHRTGYDYILICEDDHQFTSHYTASMLQQCIAEAQFMHADVLSGGVSWFQTEIEATRHLFWIEQFSGTQFILVFRNFFPAILNAEFNEADNADYKIRSLTKKVFVTYPFISIQKDFGYSDATARNNKKGQVKNLFKKSEAAFGFLSKIADHYRKMGSCERLIPEYAHYNDISIKTYVICSAHNTESLLHVKRQFQNKPEFDIKTVAATERSHITGNYWKSIREIVKHALENEEDVIVICYDDHEFTEHYSRDAFIRSVIESHHQGADYLSGGVDDFRNAVMVAGNRFWIDTAIAPVFLVVYRKFFQVIMDEPVKPKPITYLKLSGMTANKMTFFPFISRKKKEPASDKPLSAESRLQNIFDAYLDYHTEKIITIPEGC